MKKQATYRINLLVDGQDINIERTFIEEQNTEDYGNGKYVSVLNSNFELQEVVDVRYDTKYDFIPFCENYIQTGWKSRLQSFVLLDCEE